MISMWVVALLLTITATNGKISFFPIFPVVDQNILKCLKGEGYLDQAFTVMDYDNSNHLWSAFASPESMNNAGTKPDIILNLEAIRWASFSPEIYSDQILKQFSKTNLNKIWLSPYALIQSSKPTCADIRDFAKTLQVKTGLQIGIFSNRASWIKTFGAPNDCQDLKVLPLFNYGFGQTEPAPFGGWHRWDFQYLKTNYICNNNFVEIKQMM